MWEIPLLGVLPTRQAHIFFREDFRENVGQSD
jgi:hypothetical protein